MNTKGILLVAVAGCLLLGAADKAEAVAVPCFGCVSTADFREAAALRGRGVHDVYNLDNNTIQRWQIPDTGTVPLSAGQGASTKAAPPQSTPRQLENSPSAVDELNKAHQVYVLGGKSIRPIFVVPHGQLSLTLTQGRTIHDVVFDQNLRAQIASAAASDTLISRITSESLITAMQDLKSLAASSLGLRDQAGLIIRVVMEDGGYVDVKVDIDEPVGNVLDDTARTASGQLVPTTPAQAVGTWTYSPVDNLNAMTNHLQRLGVALENRGAGGTVRTITCAITMCVIEWHPR